jgi:hypothetical protein
MASRVCLGGSPAGFDLFTMICTPTSRLLLAALALLLSLGCKGRDGTPPSAETARVEAEIRSFLDRYFATWSAQDMDGYADCFHEQARVTFVQPNGEITTDTRSDFLHGQRLGHQTSRERMTETADRIDLEFDHRAALARVRWTLSRGVEKTRGIDHFSLIRTSQGWKIIHLLFYTD